MIGCGSSKISLRQSLAVLLTAMAVGIPPHAAAATSTPMGCASITNPVASNGISERQCRFNLGEGTHAFRAEVTTPLSGTTTVKVTTRSGVTVYSAICTFEVGVLEQSASCSRTVSPTHFRGDAAGRTPMGYFMSGAVFLPDGGNISAGTQGLAAMRFTTTGA